LQNQLNVAQGELDSWTNSSNQQAEQVNTAQTAVMEAQDALDEAAALYNSNKVIYDNYFDIVNSAEQAVTIAINDVNVASDLVDTTYNAYVLSQQNSDSAEVQMKSGTG